jgi:hypothetical protein
MLNNVLATVTDGSARKSVTDWIMSDRPAIASWLGAHTDANAQLGVDDSAWATVL